MGRGDLFPKSPRLLCVLPLSILYVHNTILHKEISNLNWTVLSASSRWTCTVRVCSFLWYPWLHVPEWIFLRKCEWIFGGMRFSSQGLKQASWQIFFQPAILCVSYCQDTVFVEYAMGLAWCEKQLYVTMCPVFKHMSPYCASFVLCEEPTLAVF